MNILIHIGYGKTATTWMQNIFFPYVTEINYLGKTSRSYPDWLIQWSYYDDVQFGKSKDALRDMVLSKCKEDKLNVISSEAFLRPGGAYVNQAQRIKTLFPNAKILVVLRDPVKAIVSFYKNHVQEQGFYLPLEDCIDWHRTPMVFYKRKPIFLADYYYDEMLSIYHSLFNKSQVLLLQYEEFCDNAISFLGKMFKFMNISLEIPDTMLSIKENKSPRCTKELNILREKNLLTHLKKYSINDNAIRIRDEAIDNKTVAELEKHFTGRCLGYY